MWWLLCDLHCVSMLSRVNISLAVRVRMLLNVNIYVVDVVCLRAYAFCQYVIESQSVNIVLTDIIYKTHHTPINIQGVAGVQLARRYSDQST